MDRLTDRAAVLASAAAVVQERPGDAAALMQLGFANFDLNRYTEAQDALEQAIAIDLRLAAAHEKIGHIHYRRNEPAEAVRAYEQAIAIDPHYIWSYYGLAILYAGRLNDPEQAAAALQRGLAANPGDVFLQNMLAANTARMGKLAEAQQMFERLAEEYPQDPDAFSWLSMLSLREKRWEQVAALCRREIAVQPNHSAYRLLGFAEHGMNRGAEAEAALRQALALEPRDYEARAALSKLLRERGQPEEAEEQYRAAVDDSQEDEEYGLACVLAVTGQAAQAVELLETAFRKGQVTLGWLAIDPELVYVQDVPRFQALVQEASYKG